MQASKACKLDDRMMNLEVAHTNQQETNAKLMEAMENLRAECKLLKDG